MPPELQMYFYFIVLTVSINNLLQFLSRVFKGPPVNT